MGRGLSPLLVSAAIALFVLTGCSADRPEWESDAGGFADAGGPVDAGSSEEVADSGSEANPDAGCPVCSTDCAVPPVSLADESYDDTSQPACTEHDCLCASEAIATRLLSCDSVTAGYFEPLGSTAFRVMGRSGGNCILEVGREIEGGVNVYRCVLPLPMSAWAGLQPDGGGFLEGIFEKCELVTQCSVQVGGPNPCEMDPTHPPVCRAGGVCPD